MKVLALSLLLTSCHLATKADVLDTRVALLDGQEAQSAKRLAQTQAALDAAQSEIDRLRGEAGDAADAQRTKEEDDWGAATQIALAGIAALTGGVGARLKSKSGALIRELRGVVEAQGEEVERLKGLVEALSKNAA